MASGGASAREAPVQPSKVAVRRLQQDLVHLQRSPNPQIAVRTATNNLLEWHFVLHSLPKDTPYGEGRYHGQIKFPADFPMSPPGLIMITPNGRLEVNRRLCLSMTDFHPESWNPAWSTETILVGLLSFFVADSETGFGSIVRSAEERRALAAESMAFNRASAGFAELFPEMLQPSPGHGVQPPSTSMEMEREGASPVAALSLGATPAELARPLLPLPPSPRRPGQVSPSGPYVAPGAAATTGAAAPPAGATPAATADGEDASPAERPPPTAGETGEPEGRPECWICRDDTGEPLIHPCRCRGTMSGVHASCVNAWVAHSRRSAVNAAPPRCSVCHEPYAGEEERPGFRGFAQQMCSNFSSTALRAVVYSIFVLVFQAATVPNAKVPTMLRVIIVTVCGVAWLIKIAMLTASLPLGAMPPRNRVLRWLHIADLEKLSLCAAEVVACCTFFCFFSLIGLSDWRFTVPFTACALAPLVRAAMGLTSGGAGPLRCLASLIMVLTYAVLCPFLTLFYLCRYTYRNPGKVLSPLGATWHMVVAVAALPLCLCLPTNVPVLAMWATHEVYLIVVLVDLLGPKRWRWRKGVEWGFAVQLVFIAAYVSNLLCVFPEGLGGKKQSWIFIFGTSIVWLVTFILVTLLVNKTIIVNFYNVWQSRHGHFTLRDTPDGGEGGGTRQPTQAEEVSLPV